MTQYSVHQLARLAGVTVRTLHYYDRIGLLRPTLRTEARYRWYGEKELLRLQQILFYKELDFSLMEIREILDDPAFDLVRALESHKAGLQSRRERIDTLVRTIEKTIVNLKKEEKMKHEELYEGLPREKAKAYREEAINKYGREEVERSENQQLQKGKEGFIRLKAENEEIVRRLVSLMREDPNGPAVQEQVARHYAVIRQFWGTAGSADLQADAYRGLGKLYVSDERFTMVDGKPNPEFAAFMNQAMSHFADTRLK